MGTFIWLGEPVKIIEMNQLQVISNAILAFEPSMKVLTKLGDTVAALMSKGEITSDQCYALKGNRLVSEKLMAKTLGDPDEITDLTPFEILMEIRNEGKEEGKTEVLENANRRIQEAEKTVEYLQIKHQQESSQREEEENKVKCKLIQDALNDKYKLKASADKAIRKARKWRKASDRFTQAVAILMIVALIIGIISIFWCKENNLLPAAVAQICTVVPIIYLLVNFVYSLGANHSINIFLTTQKLIDRFYCFVCSRYGWTLEEYEQLQIEINDLEQKLEKYSQSENKIPA